jgi:hypothetical protein
MPQCPLEYQEMVKFRDAYQQPTNEEGFEDKIVTIYWKFEGDEEERKRYMMWLDF